VDSLLDFIAKPESGGDFNAVWGRIKAADRPKKPLTKMTIGEVLDWQDSIDPYYNSEASGAWQFMEDTLRGLYAEAGLSRSSMFDEKNQRILATQLLRRRGLDDYLSGELNAKKFAQSLSKEWASLPCTIKDRKGRAAQGQSYYAGDGLNRSHVTISALMKAVNDAKSEPVAPIPDHTPEAPPSAAPSIWRTIINAILSIFGKGQK
jgi:hypothetical protein